jgi:hypothetical protein
VHGFHFGFKQQTSRVHATRRLQVFSLQLIAMKFARLYRAVVQNFYAGVNGAFRCQSLCCRRSWRVLRLCSLNRSLVPFDALFVEFGDKLLISSRRTESAMGFVDSGRRWSWNKRQQKTAQLCGIEALVLFRGVHGGERGFVLFAPFRWNMRRSDAPRRSIGLLLRRYQECCQLDVTSAFRQHHSSHIQSVILKAGNRTLAEDHRLLNIHQRFTLQCTVIWQAVLFLEYSQPSTLTHILILFLALSKVPQEVT